MILWEQWLTQNFIKGVKVTQLLLVLSTNIHKGKALVELHGPDELISRAREDVVPFTMTKYMTENIR